VGSRKKPAHHCWQRDRSASKKGGKTKGGGRASPIDIFCKEKGGGGGTQGGKTGAQNFSGRLSVRAAEKRGEAKRGGKTCVRSFRALRQQGKGGNLRPAERRRMTRERWLADPASLCKRRGRLGRRSRPLPVKKVGRGNNRFLALDAVKKERTPCAVTISAAIGGEGITGEGVPPRWFLSSRARASEKGAGCVYDLFLIDAAKKKRRRGNWSRKRGIHRVLIFPARKIPNPCELTGEKPVRKNPRGTRHTLSCGQREREINAKRRASFRPSAELKEEEGRGGGCVDL